MWSKLLSFVLAAGVLATSLYLYRHRHELFRPNFKTTGGTVLEFALDGPPPPRGLEEVVALLQRRFDPGNAHGLVVRAREDGQIEIRVPAGAVHDDLVDRVERLIGRTGQFEMRLIARTDLDEPALVAARHALETPAGREAVPPPAPVGKDGKPLFDCKVTGEGPFRYAWARLSPAEVRMFRLDDVALHRDNPVDFPHVTHSLQTGQGFSPTHAPDGFVTARKVPGSPDPGFYILTRELPEERRIEHRHLSRVVPMPYGATFGATLRLDKEGAERMFNLTSRNLTHARFGVDTKRIALLLDGEVTLALGMVAPARSQLEMPGLLTAKEGEDTVALIRGGTLDVRIRTTPVRKSTIKPAN